ncbi:MAG: ferredoxin, partial [Longimicrobiales bacterium]
YAERSFDELTVRIDRWTCVGYGDCMQVAPEVFEFDDRGLCSFRRDAPVIARDRLITACDVCPVDALAVFDSRGTRLV